MLPRQPPIAGQRKIFPFITRIFLCSSPHGRPAESSARGLVRGIDERTSMGAMKKSDGEVRMGGGGRRIMYATARAKHTDVHIY